MEISTAWQIVLSFFSLLFISIIVNIVLGIVAWDQFKLLKFFSENLFELIKAIRYFRNHAQNLYELEAFYGDQQIKNFIEHAREVDKYLVKYEEMYSAFVNEEDIDESLFVSEEEAFEEQKQEAIISHAETEE